MNRNNRKEVQIKQVVSSLEQQADQKSASLLSELFSFLLHSKKWWLTPIIVILILLGLISFLGGTGAAPFIYTLF
jgi:hypothetical protein